MDNLNKKFTNYVQDNIFLYQKLYLLEKNPKEYQNLGDNSMESVITVSYTHLVTMYLISPTMEMML